MIKFEKMDPDLQKNKLTKLQILTQTYAHRTLQRQNEKEKRKKKRKGHQIQIQTDFKKEKMQKKPEEENATKESIIWKNQQKRA